MIRHSDLLDWEGPRYGISVTAGPKLKARLREFIVEDDPVMVRGMNWLGFHLGGVLIPRMQGDEKDFTWSSIWDPEKGVDIFTKDSHDQPQIFHRDTSLRESERDHFMINVVQASMKRSINYWNEKMTFWEFIVISLPPS
jgi:hypothetical protein